MAKFTVTIPLDARWHEQRLIGAAGITHRIPDSLYDAFISEFVTGKDGTDMPGLVWITQDEATGGGAHPDLAAHDTLGLATQAELDAHAAAADPHTVYALDTDLANHEAAADPHTGYRLESADHSHATSGLQGGQISHADLSGVTADQHHVRQHATTSTADHTFPGGTSNFLRADGAWAAPPGGGEAFPVGSIFIAAVSSNPSALLGYGTWAAFAAGRVLVGIDGADPDFDVVEETGGAKTKPISAHAGTIVADHASHTHTYTDVVNHTHATDSQGAHTHTQSVNSGTTGGLSGYTPDTSTSTSTTSGYSTGSSGAHTHTAQNPAGGVATGTTAGPSATLTHNVTQPSAHSDLNVVQPYIVVYMWKRTA